MALRSACTTKSFAWFARWLLPGAIRGADVSAAATQDRHRSSARYYSTPVEAASSSGSEEPSDGRHGHEVAPADAAQATSLRDLPAVCFLGRPNVGKSTLYNRLVRDRRAIVYNTPHGHVTRDYREGRAELAGLVFRAIDTSGIEPYADSGTILDRAKVLAEGVVKRSMGALLMLDTRQGVVPGDESVAAWLRTLVPPSRVRVVLNKAETPTSAAEARLAATWGEAMALGFGDPIPIGAETGEGLDGLYEALDAMLGPSMASSDGATRGGDGALTSGNLSRAATRPVGFRVTPGRAPESVPGDAEWDPGWRDREKVKVAVIGLPNVGKSTLANALLGYDRSLTGPEPGLTRDDVRDTVVVAGKPVELIDTAGWLDQPDYDKHDQSDGKVTLMSQRKGKRGMEECAVAVMMVDARETANHGFSLRKQEIQLLRRVQDEGRALVLVANKTDLLSPQERANFAKNLNRVLEWKAPNLVGTVVVSMSATTGRGLSDLMPAVLSAYNRWNSRVSTGQLNAWLRAAQSAHAKGGMANALGRVRYVIQTAARPPHFVAFLAGGDPLQKDQEKGLLRLLTQHFHLQGTAARLSVRTKARANAKGSQSRRGSPKGGVSTVTNKAASPAAAA